MNLTGDIQLFLPPKTPNYHAGTNSVTVNKVLVIVGANGTGKTRLGAWIEFDSPQSQSVHRVGAQRSLKMSRSVSTLSVEFAESAFIYGYSDANAGVLGNRDHKTGHKYGGDPNTSMVNDFDKLLVLLFSDDYDASTKYTQKARQSGVFEAPPATKLTTLQKIWEKVLPHRQLFIGGGFIEVAPRGLASKKYNASMMSDGERVVFYLIGQCLSAPKNAIIVIDEPEVHIHRTILTALWDAIEAEREDCKFVYVTHDLEFAASKLGSKKVWLKSYDGTFWDWQEVPDDVDIPEDVFFSILGSRKPVLFIEGDKGSLDQFLLSYIYSDHTLIPCGGHERVISVATSFRAMRQLHNMDCYGLIDRDFRSDTVVEYLRSKGTLVLELSEIENLLLLEGVIRAVASHLLKDDQADQIVEKVKDAVFSQMVADRRVLVSSTTSFNIESTFKTFNSKAQGADAIETSLDQTIRSINVKELYKEIDQKIGQIIDSRDYVNALKVFNNKGLVFNMARIFGFDGKAFIDLLKRLIKSKTPAGASIIHAMKQYSPVVQS